MTPLLPIGSSNAVERQGRTVEASKGSLPRACTLMARWYSKMNKAQHPGPMAPQGFFVFQIHSRLPIPPSPPRSRVTSHTPLHHTVGTTGAVSLITLLRGQWCPPPKKRRKHAGHGKQPNPRITPFRWRMGGRTSGKA